MIEPRTLKGFKDYLPGEQKLRQRIIDTCRDVFELYGFLPIDTPALEYAEILTNKIGEDEKLIYKFTDQGDREVALRYDLTVPLARVMAQYQNELKLPFRRYQVGAVWRAESPQKGRYREFMQTDADIIGSESLLAEAECLAAYDEIWRSLGLEVVIKINSRKIYDALAQELSLSSQQQVDLMRLIDKADKIGLDKVLGSLPEIGLQEEQIVKLKEFLSLNGQQEVFEKVRQFFAKNEEGLKALAELQECFDLAKTLGAETESLVFDLFIVRGLDYYTGIVYECILKDADFGSLGGGGRYDTLLESFSKNKVPAVGMSVGVDRVLALMLEQGKTEKTDFPKVLVMNLGEQYRDKSVEVLSQLRQIGIPAEYFYESKDLEKQFKYAESTNCDFVILIGEEEVSSGDVSLKNINTREQWTMSFEEAVSKIKPTNNN